MRFLFCFCLVLSPLQGAGFCCRPSSAAAEDRDYLTENWLDKQQVQLLTFRQCTWDFLTSALAPDRLSVAHHHCTQLGICNWGDWKAPYSGCPLTQRCRSSHIHIYVYITFRISYPWYEFLCSQWQWQGTGTKGLDSLFFFLLFLPLPLPFPLRPPYSSCSDTCMKNLPQKASCHTSTTEHKFTL